MNYVRGHRFARSAVKGFVREKLQLDAAWLSRAQCGAAVLPARGYVAKSRGSVSRKRTHRAQRVKTSNGWNAEWRNSNSLIVGQSADVYFSSVFETVGDVAGVDESKLHLVRLLIVFCQEDLAVFSYFTGRPQGAKLRECVGSADGCGVGQKEGEFFHKNEK